MSDNKMGRPSIYTEALRDEICLRIAGGESVRKISKDPGMPTDTTIFNWLSNPDFFEHYVRARSAQGHRFAEKIGELGDRVVEGNLDPEVVKAAVQCYKWCAEKLAPKSFSVKNSMDAAENKPSIEVVKYVVLNPDDKDNPAPTEPIL
jgi:hypothetical protein